MPKQLAGEIATKLTRERRRPQGHNTKKSEKWARQKMKERGIPVPSIRQVRKTHKNFLAAGKRVGRRAA